MQTYELYSRRAFAGSPERGMNAVQPCLSRPGLRPRPGAVGLPARHEFRWCSGGVPEMDVTTARMETPNYLGLGPDCRGFRNYLKTWHNSLSLSAMKIDRFHTLTRPPSPPVIPAKAGTQALVSITYQTVIARKMRHFPTHTGPTSHPPFLRKACPRPDRERQPSTLNALLANCAMPRPGLRDSQMDRGDASLQPDRI